MFSLYLSNGEEISGQMEFTNVGGILLDSNKRFSWTCLKVAGEEVASQSVYTLHHGYSV
jgi:hypothetical protein